MLHYRGQADLVEDCTSPVFEGLITLREPTKSWVAKWQRLDGFVRGMYAVKVSGNVSGDIGLLLTAPGGRGCRPRVDIYLANGVSEYSSQKKSSRFLPTMRSSIAPVTAATALGSSSY